MGTYVFAKRFEIVQKWSDQCIENSQIQQNIPDMHLLIKSIGNKMK